MTHRAIAAMGSQRCGKADGLLSGWDKKGSIMDAVFAWAGASRHVVGPDGEETAWYLTPEPS